MFAISKSCSSAAVTVFGVALLLAAAVFLGSCSRGIVTPEDRIRAMVRDAEAAAENRDLAALKEFIHEDYRDERGNDRRALLAMIHVHFLRNESVHLLTRVSDLTLQSPESARLSLFVAMAGEPIPSAERLEVLRADLYRFDLSLAGENGSSWQVREARWHRAGPRDFF